MKRRNSCGSEIEGDEVKRKRIEIQERKDGDGRKKI